MDDKLWVYYLNNNNDLEISVSLSTGSMNGGFLNTLKETPGTYPLKLSVWVICLLDFHEHQKLYSLCPTLA